MQGGRRGGADLCPGVWTPDESLHPLSVRRGEMSEHPQCPQLLHTPLHPPPPEPPPVQTPRSNNQSIYHPPTVSSPHPTCLPTLCAQLKSPENHSRNGSLKREINLVSCFFQLFGCLKRSNFGLRLLYSCSPPPPLPSRRTAFTSFKVPSLKTCGSRTRRKSGRG